MSPLQCLSSGPADLQTAAWKQLPHVLLVVDCFPKTLGGGERIVLRLARMLPRYGFRASILTFSIEAGSSFRIEDAPCPLYLLPLRRTYDLAALRGAWNLGVFLRRENVQLVQTFFESSDLWAGIVTRALSPAKLIWSRRDMGILRGRKHTLAYRWLRRLPHAVSAVSEQVRRHAIEVDGIPAERVQTIHNGLDLQLSSPLQAERSAHSLLPDSPAVILTVGNIRRVKGQDVLVRAAAKVVQTYPQVRFEFAGATLEEDFHAELLDLTRKLDLEARICFLGSIPDTQAAMGNADIFVLPSRSEGFSNALLEAMACGLPVVATDVGGNAEALQNGRNGFVVPPDDPDALASALLELLAEPVRAKRMGEAARERVAAEFSADAMMLKVVQSYRELVRT